MLILGWTPQGQFPPFQCMLAFFFLFMLIYLVLAVPGAKVLKVMLGVAVASLYWAMTFPRNIKFFFC